MSLIDADKQWIREELNRVREEVERVETSLLTEFRKSASPLEARVRTHSAASLALDLEMEQMDERVKKLEGPGI